MWGHSSGQFHFSDNIKEIIPLCKNTDNAETILYYRLLNEKYRLICSRNVGKIVTIDKTITENNYLKRGEDLCAINFLTNIYNVHTIENSLIKKVYIENGSIISFNQPLFLIEIF